MPTRSIAGVLLIVIGILFYVFGGIVLAKSIEANNSTAEKARISESTCRTQLVQIGQVTPRENGEIELEITGPNGGDIEDPRIALSDATAALAMCTNRQLVSACIGSTCGGDMDGRVKMIVRLGLINGGF